MDSPTSTGLNQFPRFVQLTDTGQRRHPQPLEIYMWQDDEGKVHGPHRVGPTSRPGDFVSSPASYAIYSTDIDTGSVN